jgi:hypothetical protein
MAPPTLPEHSECLQLHHEQRHEPLSQKRRCPPRAPMVEKVRVQLEQRNCPSAFFSGMLVWPARYREPQALQRVLAPDGPMACTRAKSRGEALSEGRHVRELSREPRRSRLRAATLSRHTHL